MDFDFDINLEVENLRTKKNKMKEYEDEKAKIIEDYKLKCEAVDLKITELNLIKKQKFREEAKKAQLELNQKYGII